MNLIPYQLNSHRLSSVLDHSRLGSKFSQIQKTYAQTSSYQAARWPNPDLILADLELVSQCHDDAPQLRSCKYCHWQRYGVRTISRVLSKSDPYSDRSFGLDRVAVFRMYFFDQVTISFTTHRASIRSFCEMGRIDGIDGMMGRR